jgi:hypothetical protein
VPGESCRLLLVAWTYRLKRRRYARDKDGIGAALALLGLAARARSHGESLLDVYDALETAHGDVMARLRASPPAELGGKR